MSAICGCRSGQVCGCCAGVEALTPLPIANRPGLGALAYRAGTHAAFLAAMKARLSAGTDPAFAGLTTRAVDDLSIALLDAWAVVADVLTFYQERIANEGYLRTATERRSVLELARLVGYAPRPGVAAGTYLAYTLEAGHRLKIPAGTRAQSVPGPGELPQTFETSAPLAARDVWNDLQVRRTRPQWLDKDRLGKGGQALYFRGADTRLVVNDALLIRFSESSGGLYRVRKVEADDEAGRTRVEVALWQPQAVWEPQQPLPAPAIASVSAVQTMDVLARHREALAASRSKAAARVGEQLDRVERALAPEAGEPDLRDVLEAEVLPGLRDEHRLAVEGGFTTLEPVLGELIADLEEVAGSEEIAADAVLPAGGEADAVPSDIVDCGAGGFEPAPTARLSDLLDRLGKRPSGRRLELSRGAGDAFAESSATIAGALTALKPELAPHLYTAWSEVPVTAPGAFEVCVFRTRASVFGHNAPLRIVRIDGNVQYSEWTFFDDETQGLTEEKDVVWLDAPYPQILPGTWMVLERPWPLPSQASRFLLCCVQEADLRARARYGMSGKCTRIRLDQPWLALDFDVDDEGADDFSVIRQTAVFAQCERLELAEEPIDPIADAVCSAKTGIRFELAGLYDGLEPGRWLIFAGERTDVTAGDDPRKPSVRIPGVPAQELALLTGVEHGYDPRHPGEHTHTTLLLAKDLTYCYRRDTLKIFANVVPATHGETRTEVLGSGDAARPLQTFTLRQKPLTWVSAATPSGIESTLLARVNDVLWHEAEGFAGVGPNGRTFVSRTDAAGSTSVVFGNGVQGARLPTGRENVRATYRVGIGKAANLAAGRISQAVDRPLGVKEVVNPLPSTGGAGPESRDQARRNAPLAVMALDRLVSVRDYADFARTFAGIAKAEAVRLSDGVRQVVAVTVAGVDDAPIDESSELFANLEAALRRFGDPHQPLRLLVREALLLVVAGYVRLHPDYLWDKVEPRIRAAMLDAFGFDRRELGQDVWLSEVLATIQGVPGVDHVDVDVLAGLSGGLTELENAAKQIRETVGPPATRLEVEPTRVRNKTTTVLPARIAYLHPDVEDLLVLQERKT